MENKRLSSALVFLLVNRGDNSWVLWGVDMCVLYTHIHEANEE